MFLLKQKIMPDNDDMKCLFACVYKNAGMVRIFLLFNVSHTASIYADMKHTMLAYIFRDLDPEKYCLFQKAGQGILETH